MAIKIRLARPDEAGTLTDTAFRAKQSNGYDAAFMAQCIAELTVAPAQIEAGDVRVAEQCGAILGFVHLGSGGSGGDASDTAEMEAIHLEPAW